MSEDALREAEDAKAAADARLRAVSQRGCVIYLVGMAGLMLTAFTLNLIMEDGNFLPAGIGLLIGLGSLIVGARARREFNEAREAAEQARQRVETLRAPRDPLQPPGADS